MTMMIFAGVREKLFLKSWMVRFKGPEYTKAKFEAALYLWTFDESTDTLCSPRGVKLKVNREASMSLEILAKHDVDLSFCPYVELREGAQGKFDLERAERRRARELEEDEKDRVREVLEPLYGRTGFELPRYRVLTKDELVAQRRHNNVHRPNNVGAEIDDLLTTAGYYMIQEEKWRLAAQDLKNNLEIIAKRCMEAEKQVSDLLIARAEGRKEGE